MTDLTHQQFEQKLRDPKAVVINVLDIEFYNNARIPGSENAPVEALDFMEQVSELANKNDPIILYSGGPDCPAAPQAARKLIEAGYRDVATFTGGMQKWQEQGGRLESDIPGAVDDLPAQGGSVDVR